MLGLILVIVVAALLLWALTQFPLDPTLVKLIRVVVIVVCVLYVVYFLFGLFGGAGGGLGFGHLNHVGSSPCRS